MYTLLSSVHEAPTVYQDWRGAARGPAGGQHKAKRGCMERLLGMKKAEDKGGDTKRGTVSRLKALQAELMKPQGTYGRTGR